MKFKEFKENSKKETDLIQVFRDFLPVVMDELKLKQLPNIRLEKYLEQDEQPSFGRFVHSNDHAEIHLAVKDRHPIDIIRTLAHELVHFKQYTQHRLNKNSGRSGSPDENEAHIKAGVIMRNFNKKFPEYFKNSSVTLGENFLGKDIGRAKETKEARVLQPKISPLRALVLEYLTFTSTGIMTIVSDGAKSPEAAEELKKVYWTLSQSGKNLQSVVNDEPKLEANKTAILKNIHDMMSYAIAHLKANMIPQEFDSKKKQINSVLTKYNDLTKNESVREAVEPNFDFEWEEAERYPEFVKIGKEAWIELASKGKAVTIKSARGINNTDAADPDSFKYLDPVKQGRALAQLKSGDVEMPIIAVYSDGWKELIGGNTRLTAMLAQNGRATVWAFKVPDEVAELAENFLGKIKGALGLGWSKIGDTVRGSMILNYLDSQNFDASQNLKKRIKSSKFKLIELDLETAKKYRDYTDKKVAFGGSMIDPDKEVHSRQWKLTHDSLIKSPPVLMSDGDILDGNHRLDRAIKLELPKIPVLMQAGKSVEENFADGKNPGRKGLAKRMGVNTKASVSSLRKTAKNSSGEKQRMAHWLANMKSGRKKAKEEYATGDKAQVKGKDPMPKAKLGRTDHPFHGKLVGED